MSKAQEPVAYILRNEYNEYRLEPMDNMKITDFPVEVEVKLYAHPAPAFKRLTEKEVEDILVGCVKPIDKGLHWDFKKLYEDLFEAITGEKHGSA